MKWSFFLGGVIGIFGGMFFISDAFGLDDHERAEKFEACHQIIDEDTTWEGEYIQEYAFKPIVISDGATLTIEAGTHIEMTEIRILEGSIDARGKKDESDYYRKAQKRPTRKLC